MDENIVDRPSTPLKAIKAFCKECFGGQVREVKRCTAIKCPLYEYRLGKNPRLSKELTDEQRHELSVMFKERMGITDEN